MATKFKIGERVLFEGRPSEVIRIYIDKYAVYYDLELINKEEDEEENVEYEVDESRIEKLD